MDTEHIITLLLFTLLGIDIAVTIRKMYIQDKLWNAIKDGEISYINAVMQYGKVHGYIKNCDEDGKDLPSE